MKRKLCMALSALMMVSGMAGFGIVAGASDGDVTLRYGIWDDNQKAALREIADKFEEENPGIKDVYKRQGWNRRRSMYEPGDISDGARHVSGKRRHVSEGFQYPD